MQDQPFPVGERTARFRAAQFPGASDADWNDWKWQVRNRIRDLGGLGRILRLTAGEEEAIRRRQGMLPPGLTPYYASLLDPDDAAQGLRRTKIPSLLEFERAPDEVPDPLGEEAHTPVPGIVHTYDDKVLFLVTDFCATYCRYCTRSRMVGGGERPPSRGMWEGALDYIRATPRIRDVLLSGGDPLTLSDDRLSWLLDQLVAIPHVEFIRIGTKVPAVLPQRITAPLLAVLRKAHPLFISLHVIHPDELTPEVAEACNRLADAGIPLGGQTVLLKGVNDDPAVMTRLNLGLLRLRVKPYYLHQCDPVLGSAHFRTPVRAGLDILRALHGRTTGYAVPQYMIDAPGGGGKVPVAPDYVHARDGEYLVLRNHRGELYRYWDPE
ncbi:MAG: KamA family radical SAM protein [Kiritimatiellia bacterium]